MLRDHLYAFANGTTDHFLIHREEIPLVYAWFSAYRVVTYDLRPVGIDGELLYEVYRDRWRVLV